MSFKPIELPYKKKELEPFISQETMEFHYDKHYKNYINKLNELIKNTKFEKKSIKYIIKNSTNEIFNNAAQVWNHEFYWKCMNPKKKYILKEKTNKLIKKKYGSIAEFKNQFISSAIKNFGSGWTWVIKKHDSIDIINTKNAENPISETDKIKILLVVDVWEHAYYIDYRNMRNEYLNHFWKIINWDFFEKNLNK